MSKLKRPLDMDIDDESSESIKDLPQYCISQANECEARNEYYLAKAWLLTGKSSCKGTTLSSSDNFNIQVKYITTK